MALILAVFPYTHVLLDIGPWSWKHYMLLDYWAKSN